MEAVYERESDLVRDFRHIVLGTSNNFKVTAIAPEFYYIEGKIDLIAKDISGDLVAFEAKLTRWRKALQQAYRNSSFAHYSYVVLPETTRKSIMRRCVSEFSRRSIGLCFLGSSGIRVEIQALKRKPIQPWLTTTAIEYIHKGC